MIGYYFKTTFTTPLFILICLVAHFISFPLFSMNESSTAKLSATEVENLINQTEDETDSTIRAPKNKDFLNVRVYNDLGAQHAWIQKDAHVGSDFSVTRNATVGGNLTVQGDTTIEGDLTISGTLIVPDGLITDNITINTITKNGITVAWPVAAGVPGSILTNDGVGNLTFTPAVGGGNVSTASDFTTNNRLVTTDLPSSVTNIKQTAVTLDGSNNISGVNTLNATKLSGSLDGSSVTKTTVAVANATQIVENATNTLTPSTLVLRDASNNFSAGTITANITGNVSGSAGTAGFATNAGSAVNFSGSLSGDVSGAQNTTKVDNVGASTATAVSAATVLANQATDSNTNSRIVRRDGSGNFAATKITSDLVGSVTGNFTGNLIGNVTGQATSAVSSTTAQWFSQDLAGDVIGAQKYTYVNTIQGTAAGTVVAGAALANAATADNALASTIVKRDINRHFTINNITLSNPGTDDSDAATRGYVNQTAGTGFVVKESVLVTSLSQTPTANVLIPIDGFTLTPNDRVLLLGQDNEIYNGIWLAQSTDWTRPDDFANGAFAGQAYVLTTTGLTQVGTSWVCNTPLAIVGTNTVTFEQFSTQGRTTGNNVGTGSGEIFKDKTGIYMNFKTLAASPVVPTATGNFVTITNSGDNETLSLAVTATSDNTPNTIISRDGNGNFVAGTMTGAASNNVLKAGDTMTGNLIMARTTGPTTRHEVQWQDDSGANTIGIKAPATISSSYAFALPANPPIGGQFLKVLPDLTTTWTPVDGPPATTKTYFVEQGGSDTINDGSLSAPFASVKKALIEANAVASMNNPVTISIGAGIFVENNSGSPLEVAADNISIVGESLLGTIIKPSDVTQPLFTTTATNVELSNFTLQSTAGSDAAAITIIADTPGKYCFKDILTLSFKTGFDISCIGATHPTIFLENARFIDNGICVSNNDAIVSITASYIKGSSTDIPGNTGIISTGNIASTNIFNTIISTCTTGIAVTGSAAQSILSCEFADTENCVICSGASTTQITGCNFFRNTDNTINVASSGANTKIVSEACNFYCSDDLNPRGTVFKVTNAGEIVATSHVVHNAALGIECGTTGDTDTTVMKAGSVYLIGCTKDIQQTSTSILRFLSGIFDAGKVTIADATNVSIASYDRPGAYGDITLSVGNAKDVSQKIYEIFQSESNHYPHLAYEPSYYGTKGTVYKNPQGTPTFSGTLASGNNAYSYIITSSRDKETGLRLISDHHLIDGSDGMGSGANVRGWTISKLSTSADLAFTYTNNDSSGLAVRGPNTIMQLDGTNNNIHFPVATGISPTFTTAHLVWAGDTALYRSADATLKVDDNLVVNNTLTVNSLAPTAGVVHNSAAGALSSSLIVNADVNAAAGIVDTKLATISTTGKVLDSATTATSLNTPNTIVRRDGSGNFAAGIITASLTGMVTGTASFNVLKIGDTMTGTLTLPAGTTASPSLQFSGSTNTGLSAPTANRLSFDVSGAEKMAINATTVTATTTFISAAACILAKEVCLGGLQVDTPAGGAQTVTVAAGKSLLLILPTDGNVTSYGITMPTSPLNGQMLTLTVGNAVQVNGITYPGSTVYYAVDQLRATTNMDANSNGQSVTYVYYNGTWYRCARS